MKNHKLGFKLSDKEYEFLLEKRAVAKKQGKLQLDKRLRAVILVGQKGLSQQEAARMCEVHPRNLGKWLALYRSGGYDELSACRYEGRPPRLNESQMTKLDAIVEGDPIEHGYENGGWDAAMVVEVIFKEFGVQFSASMAQKLLRKLGFSYKLPKKNSLGQTRQSSRSGWTKPCRKSSKR